VNDPSAKRGKAAGADHPIGYAVVQPAGALTLEQEGELKQTVDNARAFAGSSNARLIFDLRNVTLMDGAILEFLLDLHDECADRGGDVRLANLNSILREILVVTRLDGTFLVFDDLNSAIRGY
jgi:anti-anti-sigma factor